jgi:cell division protein ZapA (FtsZ GTPase activity inhibitor)
MSNDAKIAALKSAAEQKKQQAAENLEKAIRKLAQDNQPITFATVARVAGVSVSYLYKYPEIKERIDSLRKQQIKAGKPTQPQKASDDSKAVIIYQLRGRIKQLEAEVAGLRRVNEGIAGRLYHLQGADDLAERLKVENIQLKAENSELKRQLVECRQGVDSNLSVASQDNFKVASLAQKRAGQSDISDKIEQQLDELGIKPNSTLTRTIKSAAEDTVLNAIKAFREAVASSNIEKPGAWLKRAIEGGWIPNEEIQQESELNVFNQWYALAQKKKLVLASQNTKSGIMIYTNDEKWIPFQEMLVKHPLSTL